MLRNIKIETKERDVVSLTDEIKKVVAESGVAEGLCVICTPHTTAGRSAELARKQITASDRRSYAGKGIGNPNKAQQPLKPVS